jgi:hypothetical protein
MDYLGGWLRRFARVSFHIMKLRERVMWEKDARKGENSMPITRVKY